MQTHNLGWNEDVKIKREEQEAKSHQRMKEK